MVLDIDCLITLREFAALHRVHYYSVWRWVQLGKMKAYRKGNEFLILNSDPLPESYLNKRRKS